MTSKVSMRFGVLMLLVLVAAGCNSIEPAAARPTEKPAIADLTPGPLQNMLRSAEEQTRTTKGYTQEYFVIPYPNGDVPTETGACSDVVIRAFRAAGVDLQKEVHEDMSASFLAYPKKWGLAKTDPNIDHRRVPNLQTFFTRKGKSLPLTSNAADYLPGDVVSWDLNGQGMTHIGIVSNLFDHRSGRYLIIHNIGNGAQAEDRLFDWKVTGHYKYF